MEVWEDTVHAVKNAIFNPSHRDFTQVKVPSFLFLFSYRSILMLFIGGWISVIRSEHN
jgi:hypothetical protein